MNEHTSLWEYIDYALQPLYTNKLLIVFSSIVSSIVLFAIDKINGTVVFLSTALLVHSAFIITYTILSLLDWITGFSYALFVEKQECSSSKFIKKPLLIMFCILMIYLTVSLTKTFNEYEYHGNPLLQGTLGVVVFLFEGIKIGLIVSFVVYELTSLRENFIKLKLYDFVKVVDLFLIPFIKVKEYLNKKIDKVIEDEIGGGIDKNQ